MIGHLEDPAEIRRLAPVQKQIGRRGVLVDAVATLEEAERDESVEEVTSRALMQAEPSAQGLQVLRMTGELGKDLHLDGTQKGL